MLDAINRAIAVYDNAAEWRQIMKNAMERDYSWQEQSKYIALYNSL